MQAIVQYVSYNVMHVMATRVRARVHWVQRGLFIMYLLWVVELEPPQCSGSVLGTATQRSKIVVLSCYFVQFINYHMYSEPQQHSVYL